MPVATPRMKLTRYNLPQNFVSRSHFSSPVETYRKWKKATTGPSPSVSGTSRK
jgi:hypothetical protein